jgi:hypothetical protein
MKNKTLLLIAFLCSLIYWALLNFHIPVLQSLPWWYWKFRETSLESPLFLLLGIAVGGICVAVVLYTPRKTALKILLLVIAAYALQMGFGLAEGRGLDPFRDRLTKSGQIECMKIAVGPYGISEIARTYDDLMRTELWQNDFMRTKPPGPTLFFMLAERTVHWFTGAATSEQRLQDLTTVAVFLFPFLAALTVIPLFLFSRLFLSEEFAMLPSILFTFSPNVILLTMSIDQYLFPMMAMVVLCLSAFAFARANLTLAFLAGLVLYLSLYASFSLIPLALLAPLVAVSLWASLRKSSNSVQELTTLIGVAAAGLLVTMLLFQALFHYGILTRFSAAISAHQDIKSWIPGFENTIAFAFIDQLEFACAIGLAVALIFLDQLVATTVDVTRKQIDAEGYLAASVAIVLFALAIFGKVKAESARLWLFLVPMVCVVVANRIVKRFGTNPRVVLLFLLLLQLVTSLLLKRYEDFYRPII